MNNRTVLAQRLHEVASSINIAFALVAFFLSGGTEIPQYYFLQMDFFLSRRLGLIPTLPGLKVPKDDYTEGYFAFFIPAMVLAVAVWALLRLSARRSSTQEFLRSVAGITAIAAAPLWWLSMPYIRNGIRGWIWTDKIAFVELTVVLMIAGFYRFGKWPKSDQTMIALITLHYGFWSSQFGTHQWLYQALVGPIVGLCASLAWVFFIRQTRRAESAT